MLNIGKVSLGVANKRYTHNLSFDNNTTFSFGAIQPLFSQLMTAKASVKLSAKQLVRLAPMPVPTFGRMKLVNKYCFVPISDVFPAYEALMSGIPYTAHYAGASVAESQFSYIPRSVPTISNRVLLCMLLGYCDFSIWSYTKDGDVAYGDKPIVKNTEGESPYNIAVRGLRDRMHNDHFYDSELMVNPNFVGPDGDFITPTGADYVFRLENLKGTAGEGPYTFLYCFRFTQKAKRLRSILIGLGYSLDFANDDDISLLPILCFYKAYFDNFALYRTQQWSTTNCYGLIKKIEDAAFTDFRSLFDGTLHSSTVEHTVIRKDFYGLFDDLCDCWYVYNDDYFSANRLSLTNDINVDNLSFVNADGSVGRTFYDTSSKAGDTTLGKETNNARSKQPFVGGDLSLIGLQVCQRLTRYVNKDSVIGKKMSDWVRVHFGADVANSLYKDVFNVGQSVVPIQVDDIFSTADTATASNQGEVLGAYGGKGIAFDKSGFSFTAPYAGYLICLSAIVPESRYFQGCDPTLYGIDKYTLPSKDFDALGYEVTPLGAVFGDNGLCADNLLKDGARTSKGFGFMPRFSGYKIKKDIVNGDMSRRPTMDDLSPYYLDRIISNQNYHVTIDENKNYHVVFTAESDIRDPQVLRYACRYNNLGNFNRIFYNSGSIFNGYSDDKEQPLMDDNFIVQSVYDMRLTDGLKPISMSYDTFEEETDNSTKDVSQD